MGYVFVAKTSEIAPGTGRLFEIEKHKVALFNLDGEFYAIDDLCTHEEASLSSGVVKDEAIECPKHGALFSIKTGAVLAMPAVVPVGTYAVMVEDDQVLIDLSSESTKQVHK